MAFTSSYFLAFGNPDFAAVFSGGGSAQARRPLPSADDHAARVAKAAASSGSSAERHAPSVFCVPDMEAEEAHHLLDECTLCHKALCGDIFMYRGDTPFCSDECRREQIDMDRAKHRRQKQNSPTAQQAVVAHREPPQRQLNSATAVTGAHPWRIHTHDPAH